MTVCSRCNQELEPTVPVVRAKARYGVLEIICEPCWRSAAAQWLCRNGPGTEEYPRSEDIARAAVLQHGAYPVFVARNIITTPCARCGRPVVHAEGFPGVCSPECGTAEPVSTDRPCEECGETFTPKRSDARYCSGACRVRAHRARSRASHL